MAAKLDVGEGAIIVPVELPVAVRRLRDRMDHAAALGVPAHVTLLFPFVPPDQLDDEGRRKLAGIVAREQAFPFSLARVGRWPDVVYLAPEPDEPFRRLTAALAEAFADYPPYEGVHDEVVPHVTIVESPRPDYLAAAEHALPAMLPIRDVAREAWVIGHPPGQPWRTHLRLPLGAPAGR
ncbi:MAG TPA: 2'-5' RNA ligase family protein [Candidatus Limnocylindria bacterium]|nr:2'-5' RNA ligase family protein [Candidatus Limnocylindria bacterium]